MDSIRVFGRFCVNLADSERVSKYKMMAVDPVGVLMLYAHLEWAEMIDSGAFWAKVGDFLTFWQFSAKPVDTERVLRVATMVDDDRDELTMSSNLKLPETSGFWVKNRVFSNFW
jgi:hypothetical protein